MRPWEIKPARDLQQAGLARYCNPRREYGLLSSLLRLGWWSSLRLLLGVINRLEVRGRENVPAGGPIVLVANHESHYDALVIGSALPLAMRDCLFPLAAGDVFFESPATAAFAAHFLNALPVWRRNAGRHGLDDLRQRLVEEEAVYILFPEGSRSRDGAMKPFKPGVGMLVAGTPAAVVPCYLDGTFEAFPPGARLPRWSKVRLRLGAPRRFDDVRPGRDGWEQITRALEQDVRALGGPPR
jgi:1-acyl-sn-glycerol-3-phosphate acyltransferase